MISHWINYLSIVCFLLWTILLLAFSIFSYWYAIIFMIKTQIVISHISLFRPLNRLGLSDIETEALFQILVIFYCKLLYHEVPSISATIFLHNVSFTVCSGIYDARILELTSVTIIQHEICDFLTNPTTVKTRLLLWHGHQSSLLIKIVNEYVVHLLCSMFMSCWIV